MPFPPARFEVAAYDFTAALKLSEELEVSHTLAQVLVRRGMSEPAAARRFLAADEAHPLQDFGGLAPATELIFAHIARRSRITVHGDYDVDGVCSSAILIRVLRTLGAEVDWFLPSRMEDGYGLSASTVDRLARRGTDLLLTADCAITAVDEVAAARAAGMDVVVTDHHAPRSDGALPEAPIVHPRLGDYPCPELCAAGVAYKLAGMLLERADRDPALADEDLDLVAVATVADVVPLIGENRRLVRQGLRALASTAKPGLQALMAVSRLDPSGVDAQAVGFRLAPRINAAGRLYRADAGLELLLTQDPDRAKAIAEELDAMNLERRDVETRIRFEAEKLAGEAGSGAPGFVLASDGWHPGVIGIVAARIAERHHRPAVLIALDGESGTGSGRSIPGFDLLGGLAAASDELERYGGHRAAAGLTLARNRVDAFREAFCGHAAAVLTPEDLVRRERIDAVVTGGALDLGLAEELERLEPVGAGNPAVTLLVPAAVCDDPRAMGQGRHLAFTLSAGGVRSRCVSFGRGSNLPADPDDAVDAAVRLEVNRYNGAVEPRLILRHAAPCCSAPIKLLGEPVSFFEGVQAELDRDLTCAPAVVDTQRIVHDHRHEGIAGRLADLVATGERVLAVAAHAPQRAQALGTRVGGFDLVSYAALADAPELAVTYEHVVALDPPAFSERPQIAGAGHIHLTWGVPELRFALRLLQWDYALRESLASVFRALRAAGGVEGEEALEAVLLGNDSQPRSAALAGRLVRVLSELELVRLDRSGPVITVAEAPARTALERSDAYLTYQARLEDGLRFLTIDTSAQMAA